MEIEKTFDEERAAGPPALEWPYAALLALTEHILHTTARTPDTGELLQNPQPPHNKIEQKKGTP
jgi:hypothetical protein